MKKGKSTAEPSSGEALNIKIITREIHAVLNRNQNETFLRAALTRILALEKLLNQ